MGWIDEHKLWEDKASDPIGDIKRLTELIHNLPLELPRIEQCELCKGYGDLNVWYDWLITTTNNTYTIKEGKLVPLSKIHFYHKVCYDAR